MTTTGTTPNNPKQKLAAGGQLTGGAHAADSTYVELYRRGLALTDMRENPRRRARFFQMIQMLKLTKGLSGATAETGCYRGLSSFLICHYLKLEDASYQGGRHFLIDSYQGLSRPVAKDGVQSLMRYDRDAFKSTSVEQVKKTMHEFAHSNVVQGWIPQVFSRLREQKYRFVHIDVDLYEPTLASLRYFFPRLVPGGIVIVDDYGPWSNKNWAGCAVAVQEFSDETRIPFATLDTGNAVLINR